jgi:hypothetical protein
MFKPYFSPAAAFTSAFEFAFNAVEDWLASEATDVEVLTLVSPEAWGTLWVISLVSFIVEFVLDFI